MGYQSSDLSCQQFVELLIIVDAPHKGNKICKLVHIIVFLMSIGYVYSLPMHSARMMGIRKTTANKTISSWEKNKGGNGKQLIKFAWPYS